MDATLASEVMTTTAADSDQAVGVLALAFSADPAARWTYPDPQQYLTHFPSVARAFGGKAFFHSTGHHLQGFAGAALWLPPGVGPDEEALAAVLQESVADPLRSEVFAIFERMSGYRPSEPHWYLPLIGVDPIHQGRGHGSALLRHALAQCDQEHAIAYLESSNPANIPLYQRHGFETLGTIQAGSSPRIFPMLRPAR